jgi:hypothetical protein
MEIEEILDKASSRIKAAREELHALLPDRGRIDEFGPAYTAALFANVAVHLQAVEILIREGLTSSAAVVLRTFIFGAIRLAWLANAESREELDARVVAFQKSSLDYESGLLSKAEKSGGDRDQIEELSEMLEQQKEEVQGWKSETGTGKRQVDEIKIAETLSDMSGLITGVAILDQHVHVNRVAINSVLAPDPEIEEAVVIGHRPEPSLIPVMVTASMQGLSIAAQSFLKVVDPDPATIEQIHAAGQRWINDAIEDAEAQLTGPRNPSPT